MSIKQQTIYHGTCDRCGEKGVVDPNWWTLLSPSTHLLHITDKWESAAQSTGQNGYKVDLCPTCTQGFVTWWNLDADKKKKITPYDWTTKILGEPS